MKRWKATFNTGLESRPETRSSIYRASLSESVGPTNKLMYTCEIWRTEKLSQQHDTQRSKFFSLHSIPALTRVAATQQSAYFNPQTKPRPHLV
ncbi:hypothetical protein FRC03_011034 [Tulasnella sp. 419]|nr:hypothetical protein FRC03_011034 [Tulasnella sp. 419]